MPALEHFCTVTASMRPRLLGNMPSGVRIDFPFEGTATGPHWEGEREVKGIDYVTVRGDGHMDLEIHGTIGAKRETVAYRGAGVSLAVSEMEAHPQELISFQTGNEDLAWLNTVVGVGLGKGEAGELSLDIFVVRP
ncbi:MAG TPA: DUF3237 family protein [Acidimicrobiia bacterium]